MSFITLDYETAFRTRKDKGTKGPAYTLKNWTYEEYLRGSKVTKKHGLVEVPFRAHGVGVKIDRAPAEWVSHDDLEYFQKEMFPENNDHTVLGHNTMFDGAILHWIYKLKAKKYYDTQGMSRALWNQQPADLDSLVKRCFPDNKKMWKQKEDLSVADGIWFLDERQERIISNYCIQDVEITFAAFEKMWQMGFPPEELEVMDMTLQMFINRPFVLDSERVKKYQNRLQRNKERWYRISGWPRSTLASNDKFVARLEKEHGIKIEKVPSPTEKDPHNMRYPLAKDDLEFLDLQDNHPELKAIWKARLAATANSELSRCARMLDHGSKSWINPEGNIAMPLNYHKAHTGRWGGTNKQNPQNLGRGSILRRGLKAPEGYKVVVRDLSNIEGRMSAWFCGQEDKLKRLAAGQDIYNDMATDIYGYPVNRKDPKQEVEGFVGKVAELGLGYNMGAPKFHHTLASGAMGMRVNIGLEKATHVVQTYRRKNYCITAMWKHLQLVIQDMANPNLEPYMLGPVRIEYRRVVLPNGLALNYPGLRAIDHPEAFNEYEYWEGKFWKKIYGGLFLENIIQALSRIIMSSAMVRFRNWLGDRGQMALTVHDEVVVVVIDHLAEEAFRRLDLELIKRPDWTDPSLTLKSDGGIDTCYSK